MYYEEKSKRAALPHGVIMEGREKISVSGVEDVESFDETGVVMYTSKGTLIVKGSALHIEKLSIDGGELTVQGQIDSLAYEDEKPQSGGGFFSRLFR
jgi:sporulation protein YabP